MGEVTRMKDIIKNEFDHLCDEYNISKDICNLSIGTDIMSIYNKYGKYKDIEYYKTPKEFFDSIMIYYCDMLNNRLSHSCYYIDSNTINYEICISEHVLTNLVLKIYEDNLDKNILIKYLKITIRHEIGHILHYIEVFNKKGFEAGCKYFNYQRMRQDMAYEKFMKKLYKEYDEDENISDYDFLYKSIKNYYSHKGERTANRLANVNLKEYIKVSLAVMKV